MDKSKDISESKLKFAKGFILLGIWFAVHFGISNTVYFDRSDFPSLPWIRFFVGMLGLVPIMLISSVFMDLLGRVSTLESLDKK